MQVDTIMTKPEACSTRDSLNRAAQIMWDHDCGCVPVVDDHQVVVGMLTDRDVAMAAYTQGKRLSEMGVTEAMSRSLHVLLTGTDVAAAEQLMRQVGFRRLPVIDHQARLIGLIALPDIVRAAARIDASLCPALSETELALTLAGVARQD